tara:strand:- start:368 stop:565 length:198 start_codon:yes stop_codon:yes gene_type:complete
MLETKETLALVMLDMVEVAAEAEAVAGLRTKKADQMVVILDKTEKVQLIQAAVVVKVVLAEIVDM